MVSFGSSGERARAWRPSSVLSSPATALTLTLGSNLRMRLLFLDVAVRWMVAGMLFCAMCSDILLMIVGVDAVELSLSVVLLIMIVAWAGLRAAMFE